MAIKKGVSDSNPYVRKTAALAIPKLYECVVILASTAIQVLSPDTAFVPFHLAGRTLPITPPSSRSSLLFSRPTPVPSLSHQPS
jgi:hypothetical protein